MFAPYAIVVAALLFCGVEAPERQAWGIQDVAPLCSSAFGIPWPE